MVRIQRTMRFTFFFSTFFSSFLHIIAWFQLETPLLAGLLGNKPLKKTVNISVCNEINGVRPHLFCAI
jgi:hypothetical protein